MGEGPARVIVIDDDPDDAFLIRRHLARSRLIEAHVAAVECVQAGCKLVEEGAELVLLDLSLPGEVGTSALFKVVSAFPTLPVVVISNCEDLRDESLTLGALDFVGKGSLTTESLERSVRFALRERRRQSLQDATRRASQLDALTGVLNRRGLEASLAGVRQGIARGECFHGLIVDLDGFSVVNDRYSRSIGDIVLKETARTLQEAARVNDPVARLGGGVFCVVLQVESEFQAKLVADRIRRMIARETIFARGERIAVTASIGVVRISEMLCDATLLVSTGQRAIHRQKQATAANASNPDQLSLARAQAIESLSTGSGFYAMAQPICDLLSGQHVGFELLTRLDNPAFGSPDAFFELAAELDVEQQTDEFCLRACIDAARSLTADTYVHINILPLTLIRYGARFCELLDGVEDIEKLCFEVTEQQILGDPDRLLPAVEALRAAGASVSVDDLGFGMSFLESLVRIRPQKVKLDRSLVAKARWSDIATYVKVANAIGSGVVIEGLETQEDVERSLASGARYGQGYHLGRPARVR